MLFISLHYIFSYNISKFFAWQVKRYNFMSEGAIEFLFFCFWLYYLFVFDRKIRLNGAVDIWLLLSQALYYILYAIGMREWRRDMWRWNDTGEVGNCGGRDVYFKFCRRSHRTVSHGLSKVLNKKYAMWYLLYVIYLKVNGE